MKTDRFIGIIEYLIQQEKSTAPELADYFKVSRRTISRDIDALCVAGFPLVTAQGQNGGIALMEGYRIDPSLLTHEGMQAALTGEKLPESVTVSAEGEHWTDSLSADEPYLMPDDTFLIDLSTWHQGSLSFKIKEVQAAIEACRLLRFTYYAAPDESACRIEPYKLVFHLSSWYVWGYCLTQQDFCLFRLNRMEDLRITGNPFQKRLAPPPDLSPEALFPDQFPVKVLFAPECRWRLIDDFGLDSFTVQEDGRLLFTSTFGDKGDLFSWLLTFGGCFELMEPEELRAEMAWTGCSIQVNHAQPLPEPEDGEA